MTTRWPRQAKPAPRWAHRAEIEPRLGKFRRDRDRAPDSPKMWPWLCVIPAIALALTVPHEWGRLITDNQFSAFANPQKDLQSLLHVWNGQANLGGTVPGFAPVPFAFTSLLRSIGIEPWLVQRIYMATVMTIGGIGTALLAWRLDRKLTLTPIIAGIWFMTSPFTMSFVIPTWLFQNAALAPWFLLAALGGLTSESRWRFPALFALAVASAGSLNLPGVAWAALPVVPAIAVLVISGRASLRKAFGWIVRTSILSLLVMVPAVIRAALAADNLRQNLATTEGIGAVSQSSSWPESIRGLGSWLIYWNPQGKLVLPYLSQFLDNPWVLILTFIPVGVAVTTVAFSRWPPRVLMGVILIVSAAAMVGIFPFTSPSPFGLALQKAYELVPGFLGLRNTYKVGGGVLLATAILSARGVEYGLARLRIAFERSPIQSLRRSAGFAPGTLAFIVLAPIAIFSAWPMVSGSLVREMKGSNAPPTYWTDAISWLNHAPTDGRVMILPGSTDPAYQWGRLAGGDLAPALLQRQYLYPVPLDNASPDTLDLINALAENVVNSSYTLGTFAPIARRLGVEYVLIRNDLDWKKIGIGSPGTLDSLRSDPDLSLVASFGELGENVWPRTDKNGTPLLYEAKLAPVQIFRVAGFEGRTRTITDGPSLVVSGSGAAWPTLSGYGLISGSTPVEYSGRLDGTGLLSALDRKSLIVVTDTNRKRQVGLSSASGPTLTAAQVSGSPGLFGVPGSQSTVTFHDAKSITAINAGNIVNPGAANRPSSAFDGDPSTAWRTGAALPVIRQGLQVELNGSRRIDSMTVKAAPLRPGDRPIASIEIVLSDGSTFSQLIEDGKAEVTFPALEVTGFKVFVTSVTGSSLGPFGIAEVSVPGLDMRESVQVPDDVALAAANDTSLLKSLETAPFLYSFSRIRGLPADEESTLMRRFWTIGNRSLQTTATVQVGVSTPDEELSRLVGGDNMTFATQRWQDQLDGAGMFASDGNQETAWQAPPSSESSLVKSFASTSVRSVDVIVDGRTISSPVTFVARSGSTELGSITVSPVSSCLVTTESCLRTYSIPTKKQTINSVTLSLSPSSALPATATDSPLRIIEVQINGQRNSPLPLRISSNCLPDLLQVDGNSLPLRLSGSTQDLLNGNSIDAVGCSEKLLSSGWHDATTGWTVPVNLLRFATSNGTGQPAPTEPVPSEVTNTGPVSNEVTIPNSGPVRLISGYGSDPRWKASSDASYVELDTQAAWVVPAGTTLVHTEFRPDRFYRLSLIVWLAALIGSLALLTFDPHKKKSSFLAVLPNVVIPLWFTDALAIGFACGVAGGVGIVLGVLAVMTTRKGWIRQRALAISAVTLVILAITFMLPPLGPTLQNVGPNWANNRSVANELMKIAAVTLALSMNSGWYAARSPRQRDKKVQVGRQREKDI